MIFIALSWIYIVFTVINLGFFFDKSLKLKTLNFVYLSVLGFLSITILASFWAFFDRINIEFYFFIALINFYLFLRFRIQITFIYKNLWLEINSLIITLRFFLVLICLLILAQCSAIPFIIDNETYYIQTIKWLNQYGFVKGLGNLHIFLGQTSGWHITQSAFNFCFLYKNLNDLSGLCLLLGNFFAITKLNSYLKTKEKVDLIFGLLPFCNPLLFQFISAPSPDIAIYIFSFLLFYLFIDNFKKDSSENLNFMFILSFFLLYIKPTAIVILIIPLILLKVNHNKQLKKILPSLILECVILFLFLSKNIILTGYALYPSQLIGAINFDFAVPKELISFYFNESKLYRFFLTKTEFHTMTKYEVFIKWITVSKINSFFNIVSLSFIAIIPIFIYKFLNKKSIWILYGVMTFQLFFLLLTSPQFRFFLNFITFFTCFVISCIFISKKSITILLTFITLILMILVLYPLKISMLTNNKLSSNTSTFSLKNTFFPAENSNIKVYSKKRIGNLTYFTPNDDTYFWYGGNGNLPSVNTKQLDYFENHFQIIPQLRTTNLKDGFCSKKVKQK